MGFVPIYFGGKLVEDLGTDVFFFEKQLFFTFFKKKIAFFLAKPSKSMLKTEISIKT
jgi:hypothetical protein